MTFSPVQIEPLLGSSEGRAAGAARSETGRRAFVGLLVAALVACGFAVSHSAEHISALVQRRAGPAAGETSRTFDLRGEDFYTVDRCVMYTYYGKGLEVKDALQVEAWRASWKNAGWKPVVLDERHARIHPRYAALKQKYRSLPLGDTPSRRLEAEHSLLRYLALAAVGGGYMTEPDVFNVNVPPPPKCDWTPNGGQFTTHDVFIPAMVTCDAASCAHVAVGADTAVDEWGFVCAREQLSADTGCCAESALPRFTCDGCEAAPDGVCCVTFETCISCCLGGAAHAISSAAAALDACEDGCRTSSKSLNGSVWNRYRSEAKYCNHSGAKPAVEPPEAGAVAAAAAAAAASAGRCTGGRLACLLRSWRVRE